MYECSESLDVRPGCAEADHSSGYAFRGERSTRTHTGGLPHLPIIGSSRLGISLFARSFIPTGATLLLFTGSLITFAEAVAKGDLECYPLQVDHNKYIDLKAPGCFGNHSCEPNAGIVGDVRLVAVTDIPPGEELRYDYSTSMDEDYWTMACRCESRHCRGIVTDFRHLPEFIRERYLRLGVVQRFIARQYGYDL
jgi:hypothetical protein